jgi:hypothetical protein
MDMAASRIVKALVAVCAVGAVLCAPTKAAAQSNVGYILGVGEAF